MARSTNEKLRLATALAAIVISLMLLIPAQVALASEEPETPEAGEPPVVEPELKQNEKVGSKTDDEVVQREGEAIVEEGWSAAERKVMEESAEKHTFQTEVNRMLGIIINSLYSNREIFLREIISNASDACDKIRFIGLTDKAQLDQNPVLEIKIKADKKNGLLHIIDSGIGMTKTELISNLGTIAKSGTTEFLEAITKGADLNMIGQFGVGFYSTFLVADKVIVTSKHNDDTQWVWTSTADATFTIVEDPEGPTLQRGTRVTLQMKEDALDFLDDEKLRTVTRRYSEFINFPIKLWTSKTVSKQVPDESAAEAEAEKPEEVTEEGGEKAKEDEAATKEEGASAAEEKKAAPKMKTVSETVWDWEILNENKPIWTRSKEDVTEDEYNSFYKALTKDEKDPMAHIHFTGESSEVAFRAMLFVPREAPYSLFGDSKANNLKLYVRRVFITDEFDDLMPRYLQFLRGVVDSDDLPLNVSREMLQQHKTLKVIRRKLVRKALQLFKEIADREESADYEKFFNEFGVNIKLGVIEDSTNRTRLAKLLRFYTTKSLDKRIPLADVVGRLKEGQDQIYFVAAETLDQAKESPMIERLKAKGVEVLLLVDPIDEYVMQNLPEFEGKRLVNASREGVKLEDQKLEQKEKDYDTQFKPLSEWFKKTLGERIEKAKVTLKLTESPCMLVTGQYGWSANMERIMKHQTLADPKKAEFMKSKKTLECNPLHPIVKELASLVQANAEDEHAKELAEVLYDTAMLTSGFSVENTPEFAKRITSVLQQALGLGADARPEQIPEEEAEAPAADAATEEPAKKAEESEGATPDSMPAAAAEGDAAGAAGTVDAEEPHEGGEEIPYEEGAAAGRDEL